MPPRDGPDCDRLLLDDKLKVTMDDQWEEVRAAPVFAASGEGVWFFDLRRGGGGLAAAALWDSCNQ